jgi:LTXXQ motif family protein
MRSWPIVFALTLLVTYPISSSALAQDQKLSKTSVVWIPGALGRLETHGPGGYSRLCSPQSVGFNEWRSDYLVYLIKPTKLQMESFNRLQAASAAAKSAVASSCVRETISTGPSQVAEMEKRLNGLLQSIKVLREPYESFYASLDNHQKALLDGLGPSRRGWSW